MLRWLFGAASIAAQLAQSHLPTLVALVHGPSQMTTRAQKRCHAR